MKSTSLAILCACAFLITPVNADVGVSVKIGTLGPGIDVTMPISERGNLRVFGHKFSHSFVANRVEGDITTDVEGLNYGALLDFHPGGGGFRLSLGFMYNANEVELNADLTKPVELSGIDFDLDDLTGDITFDDLAPYIGIGYGNAVGKDGNWHFSFDLGVFYQGEPQVEASAVSSIPFIQPIVDAALTAELDDIEEDAEEYDLYPFVAVGLSYKF